MISLRIFLSSVLAMLILVTAVTAQSQAPNLDASPPPDRSATGGATTLDDIMARQRGQNLDNAYRATNTGADKSTGGIGSQLGTRGAASDSDVFRALRYGSADVSVSARGPATGVVIQDGGMWWLQIRNGPMAMYGAYLLGATLAALALFYLLRGKIRIDGQKLGQTITRFSGFERFGHWLFAGSFILLAVTGLITLFGRKVLIPAFGHDLFSTLAIGSKWIHNNVAWAFMLGLILIIVTWTFHNIPNKHDLVWLAKGGGLFSKGTHPPARKFNAGQKIIFWGCVVLGLSISLSGLSLLFPFEMPMFAKTFGLINDIGVPGWFGFAPLPETLPPHEEMQYSQLWHASIAFVFIAMIMAHIYLGSIGMEGAFDAMGTGEVEEQWAREHHSLWVDEVKAAEQANAKDRIATPAE